MMDYRYLKTKENYAHFSSGQVLYSLPGQSAFPVRLASEIIQRCFALLEAKGKKGPYTLYDPCCGGAYLLTILAFLHAERLKKIYASDIDPQALLIAKKNLDLLKEQGLNQRIKDLKELADRYGKFSHFNAVEKAQDLVTLSYLSNSIETVCFERDITSSNTKIERQPEIDIVLTDFPYGQLVNWKTQASDPILAFFNTLAQILIPHYSVIAIISNKQQKITPSGFNKIEHFKNGKRHIKIFCKNKDSA